MYKVKEALTHQGTKHIETPRLILRQFAVADAPAMYANWASDPEVTKFLTWPVHESPEATAELLKDWVKGYETTSYYQWAIALKARNCEPIGSISVVSHDDRIRKAEIGYCIGRSWWHQGITSEALSAVIRFLIQEVGMQRVEARHDPNNPHSGAVMQKCGMEFEGTQRRADRSNQGIVDISTYAILADME